MHSQFIKPAVAGWRMAGCGSLLVLLVACASYGPPPAPALSGSATVPRTAIADQAQLASLSPTALASNFVDRVIHDLPVDDHRALFRALDAEALDAALDTPAKQLSFWINVYNGHAQYFLKTDPSLYQRKRSAFFGKEQIEVAGYRVSMEEIEHGVLRRGATIWSFGYVRLLFLRSEFARRFAVDEVDYRIHFALNCGAKSCPPVMAYQAATAEEQLDANSRIYLQAEASYDAEQGVVWTPALLSWFSADFGGSDKAKIRLMKRHGLLPADAKPRIKYLKYDWTMLIENYSAHLPAE